MIPARAIIAATVVAACALVATAHAETHRIAVVVGNNAGGGALPPLRFAETDAAKVGDVLVEMGGVARRDLFLVQGGNRAAVESAMAQASSRIAARRRATGARVILVFYFSGHSDGTALELGRQRLGFSELRRWLGSTGANVRVAFIDTCRSGALLAAKGGTPGPAFQIRLTEDLASSGEALLTSSAADEVALESREIGGSFFTHHLVSGLRGAADTSGDGRVTLGEVYQYAYGHTITTTGATLAGPQHPVYDYRLTGRGELVLTEPTSRAGARIALPPGYQRVLIVDPVRRRVVAELGNEAVRIGVPAGRYVVRAWRDGRAREGTITVASGETRLLRASDLGAALTSDEAVKGVVDLTTPSRAGLRGGPALGLALGAQAGVADDLDAVPSLRAGIAAAGASGAAYSLVVGSGRGDGYRETHAMLRAGYRRGTGRADVRAWLGIDMGAGAIVQTGGDAGTAWTATVAAEPGAGVAVVPYAAARVWLTLEAGVAVTFLRRDDVTSALLLPALRLGISIPL